MSMGPTAREPLAGSRKQKAAVFPLAKVQQQSGGCRSSRGHREAPELHQSTTEARSVSSSSLMIKPQWFTSPPVSPQPRHLHITGWISCDKKHFNHHLHHRHHQHLYHDRTENISIITFITTIIFIITITTIIIIFITISIHQSPLVATATNYSPHHTHIRSNATPTRANQETSHW